MAMEMKIWSLTLSKVAWSPLIWHPACRQLMLSAKLTTASHVSTTQRNLSKLRCCTLTMLHAKKGGDEVHFELWWTWFLFTVHGSTQMVPQSAWGILATSVANPWKVTTAREKDSPEVWQLLEEIEEKETEPWLNHSNSCWGILGSVEGCNVTLAILATCVWPGTLPPHSSVLTFSQHLSALKCTLPHFYNHHCDFWCSGRVSEMNRHMHFSFIDCIFDTVLIK